MRMEEGIGAPPSAAIQNVSTLSPKSWSGLVCKYVSLLLTCDVSNLVKQNISTYDNTV